MSHHDEASVDDRAIESPIGIDEPAPTAEAAESADERAGDRGDNVVPFPTAPDPTRDESDDADPVLRDVIGDVLRDERLDQDRTLADVADDAAVSLPYLSEVERGRKEVSSDVLDAIIRSLGLDLAEVLERAADRLRANELRMGADRVGPQLLAA